MQRPEPEQLRTEDLSYSDRHWPASYATCQQLKKESDYATWVYAMGYRPNHFTRLVNALRAHPDIRQVNDFLREQGHRLNGCGGLVKGGPG